MRDYSGISLQLRMCEGYQDDFSDTYGYSKSLEKKMVQFIKLRREIFPNAKPIQLWKMTTEIVAKEVELK